MTAIRTSGTALFLLALIGFAPIHAEDKKPNMKLPPLDAKEWKKLESGMKVWDVKEGKGTACPADAEVEVHYTGWLTNGEVFDSSHKRGETITFPLSGVIKGWTTGVPGMKPGGIRRLMIPPELAYGAQKKGPIPANSTLIFEIELISVKK